MRNFILNIIYDILVSCNHSFGARHVNYRLKLTNKGQAKSLCINSNTKKEG